MRYKIIPIIIGAVTLSSCSTAYRSSQTPDDLYYSPAKEIKETADDYNTENSDDDSYLRMKAHNYALWSSIDDYTYWNDSRYDFGYSCTPSRFAFITSFNMYPFGWGYRYGLYGGGWYGWNSPHSTVVYYKNPRVYYGSTTNTNLTAYRNNSYNNHNTYNQNNLGGLFRRAFSNTNSNTYHNGNNNNNPARTFNTGTNTSNNAGGRSGGYHSTGSSSSTPRTSRPPH